MRSGLNPITASRARRLSKRPQGQPETGTSRRWIPMVLRAGQRSSAPSPAPLLSGTQNCLLFTQGSPLSVLSTAARQNTGPGSYRKGPGQAAWKTGGCELKITCTYTARECHFLIPTSGWVWQISGKSRRCEGKGVRDTNCYAANAPPPKAPSCWGRDPAFTSRWL